MSKNIEIERKFLVNFQHDKRNISEILDQLSSRKFSIKQAYILTSPDKTVRVRIKGEKAYLTIKGKTNAQGFSRFEWEKEISIEDAELLFELCEQYTIDKTRYEVIFEGQTFEIDVFHGLHEGLILAELELEAEDESYVAPNWLAEEVTGDIRYYNSYLSKRPFVVE